MGYLLRRWPDYEELLSCKFCLTLGFPAHLAVLLFLDPTHIAFEKYFTRATSQSRYTAFV